MKKLLLILFLFGCENTITDNSTSDSPPVGGCTDPIANNYNAIAEVDDGSCTYENIVFGVIINEINYNSSDDLNSEDWVELHNPTNETIEIGLWEFKDSDNDDVFTLPEDTVLLSGDYLVLCKNTDSFSQVFPGVSGVVGDFEFGLDGAGELVRLFNSNGLLVDEVEYDDITPWPTEPDGTGPTLELIHPSLDNALGENWAASNDNGGTPGGINSVVDE